ncbi:hypothetical protein [Herbinix luporum]|jgi:hypothetical protein|nr:hypothetical protein [Herbinix luporum]MDI9488288.1 hypothetical protein [Bacillota bacterium]HHT57220.1 hypothetical protein [Herbinix luporum]
MAKNKNNKPKNSSKNAKSKNQAKNSVKNTHAEVADDSPGRSGPGGN